MRVLLADDETQVRSALRLILEQLKAVESIEEVSDARGLTARMQANRPDLLLVDWELPGLRAVPSFSELRRRHDTGFNGRLKVIVLSDRCPAPQAAIRSGADCCLSKYEPPEHLFAALHAMGAD